MYAQGQWTDGPEMVLLNAASYIYCEDITRVKSMFVINR